MGSADKSKDLYDLFEQDGVSLSNWTNKSRKHIADLAEAAFDTPSDAHNALTKGQGLFKQRSVETFELCKIIFREAKKKKNKKKKLRAIVNDNLKILAPLIDVPFSEIDHSKRDKQQKGLKAKGSLDRDKVISRIVERHRRLVKKNPKKFKDYINNRMLS